MWRVNKCIHRLQEQRVIGGLTQGSGPVHKGRFNKLRAAKVRRCRFLRSPTFTCPMVLPLPVSVGRGEHRLASGDNDGRVVVWDVGGVSPIVVMEDAHLAATGRKGEPGRSSGGVRALAWVMSSPLLLAVALGTGIFLLWDTVGVAARLLHVLLVEPLSPPSASSLASQHSFPAPSIGCSSLWQYCVLGTVRTLCHFDSEACLQVCAM
jgi:hypothetical protein